MDIFDCVYTYSKFSNLAKYCLKMSCQNQCLKFNKKEHFENFFIRKTFFLYIYLYSQNGLIDNEYWYLLLEVLVIDIDISWKT